MFKYFYTPTGEITYYSDEVHFETAAKDEHIIVDKFYDPRIYKVDPAKQEMVLREAPLPPLPRRRNQ